MISFHRKKLKGEWGQKSLRSAFIPFFLLFASYEIKWCFARYFPNVSSTFSSSGEGNNVETSAKIKLLYQFRLIARKNAKIHGNSNLDSTTCLQNPLKSLCNKPNVPLWRKSEKRMNVLVLCDGSDWSVRQIIFIDFCWAMARQESIRMICMTDQSLPTQSTNKPKGLR